MLRETFPEHAASLREPFERLGHRIDRTRSWIEPDARGDRPRPRLPPDAYRASGFEGQSMMIVPSLELVVVRRGWTLDEGGFRIDDFVAELIAVLPQQP